MKIEKLIQLLNKIPKEMKGNRKKYTIIACALDKKGKVLSIKTNDYNCSHPKQKYFAEKAGRPEAIFLHAEIAALISAKKDVYKLMIARVDCHGNPMLAAPCSICQKAIKEYGVTKIEYTI